MDLIIPLGQKNTLAEYMILSGVDNCPPMLDKDLTKNGMCDIMFDVNDLAGEEVFVAKQGVSDKDVNSSVDEVTLPQALAALKSEKVQEKANVVEEPSESITTTPTLATTTTCYNITATR
ncbi:hypothetical protein Tco_1294782 [Tanacetum coccineum]